MSPNATFLPCIYVIGVNPETAEQAPARAESQQSRSSQSTPASLSTNTAYYLSFRQLIYNFSQKLSKEERQAIVYIRLYECREQYRDASTLNVLSKLEMCGVFSPSDPAGLIDVAKDIHRSDLVNLVKDYIKSQRSKEKKAKAKNASAVEDTSLHSESSDEEMPQLRATLEVMLSQASVLAQQVNILQRAIVLKERQTAAEASKEAGRAVKELAEHLRKVQEALERRTSPRSSTSYSSEQGELRVLDNYVTAWLCDVMAQQDTRSSPLCVPC